MHNELEMLPRAKQQTYIDKVKSPEFAKPMSEGTSKDFIMCSLFEKKNVPLPPAEELPVPAQIILKRIEAFELPIKFSFAALLAMIAIAEGNPGYCVVALIDLVTEFEGEEITIDHIVQMYPLGMYKEEVIREYTDFLKVCKKNPLQGDDAINDARWAFLY